MSTWDTRRKELTVNGEELPMPDRELCWIIPQIFLLWTLRCGNGQPGVAEGKARAWGPSVSGLSLSRISGRGAPRLPQSPHWATAVAGWVPLVGTGDLRRTKMAVTLKAVAWGAAYSAPHTMGLRESSLHISSFTITAINKNKLPTTYHASSVLPWDWPTYQQKAD